MKSRTLLGGVAFCALAVVSLEAADRYAFRQSVAAVASRVDGLTFSRVIDEPWRGDARIIGLDWRRKDVSLHIGALNFAASALLPPIAAALAGTGSASAEDVVIETGLATYKIKKIELSGASISNSDLLALFDAKAAKPLAERLAALSAAAITIPEMTVESKVGAATQKLTYRDIALNSLVNGKAASASAAGASFSLSNPQSGDVGGAYGPMSAKDIDLVLGARILTETRDRADAPKLPLYNSLAINGFHLGNAHFDLDVKNLTVGAVKARPELKQQVDANTVEAQPQRTAKGDALRLLDCFEVDDVAASALKLELNKDGDAATFTMAQASMTRLDGSQIDSLDGKDLALDRAAGRMAVESVSFRGIDLRPLSSADHAPDLLGKDLRPDFEEIVVTKFAADATPASETAKSGGSFKVERFGIRSAAQKDDSTSGLDVALDHLVYPLDEGGDGGALPALAAMGYSRLDLTSRLNVVWTQTSKQLAINDFSLEGAGMGALKMTALIDNVTQDLASNNEQIAAAAARNLLVKKIDIRVENAGLFDRSLAAQAKSQKKSVDEVRQSDLMAATFMFPALLGNNPSARLLGSELAKFIVEPKSFNLVALAPEGFGLADLELVKTPGALLKKMAITGSANE
ncbi:hypothetical protein [Methylocella tundrae]|uniref:AsmA family protein n=1 Tax=Methylocella tundrae TaxID=227605 RepID=A0A4U8YVW2_METTU|nr:hypothetical protein [Methylocella tundrae]WPP05537.1 hypothetical protein SIN04_06865 [Methylocella tundrae]VFU07971.1 conserved exported protein of unknown function [Methylocella tundrae]